MNAMKHAALLFQFPEDSQARLAAETLDELGYEPQLHEGGRLHIHVQNEDLTSALEIVQCYSGHLLEHAPAEAVVVTDFAYGMDDIPIPAHTVNEDWVDGYRQSAEESAKDDSAYPTDDGSYDRFDAT
ncbi:hypothetical protein B1A99_18290 [Cohnella sp. CIP 111063]|uniref:hypothetical protein n=1 Tax=unclassified Cohnella TaxID=2636738 RepID=UPI000B8C5122|nr:MULTISPECIES: hypothetical protein [unclassified Cohnella]OXS56816.1 hypothetical protein B1A99_18290 [Cohnella sp. CIP 111063]